MKYNPETLKHVGKVIATERKKRHWTQEELITQLSMKDVNIGRNRLSSIENGKQTPEPIGADFLFAVCELFDCDVGFLFGDYPEKSKTVHDVCEYVGLSEESVNTLHQLSELPNKPGLRGVSLPGYSNYIEETSLLDDLITSKHFHHFFSCLAEYLIYAGALPGRVHPQKVNELSEVEYSRFMKWANDRGLTIESKKKICDMHLQKACDLLKSIYKEVLERDGKGW